LEVKSQKEKCTSRSSCKAEVKATDDCMKSVQWLLNILEDLNLLPPRPMPIFNDNQAAVIWSNSSSTKGMRHYNVRENAVHEAINEYKEVTIQHIGGKVNPADLFTKEHKSDETFHNLRDSFMSRRSSGGAGTIVHLVQGLVIHVSHLVPSQTGQCWQDVTDSGYPSR
jgi:hypothetical protein